MFCIGSQSLIPQLKVKSDTQHHSNITCVYINRQHSYSPHYDLEDKGRAFLQNNGKQPAAM